MPNRDPNNKNLSINVPDELKTRIANFVNNINKKNSLSLGKMTVRSLIVKAGYEYMAGGHNDSRTEKAT